MPDPESTPAEQKACDEALKRIGDCGRRRAVTLDLAGLGLTRLPPEICRLTKLTALDLAHNRLATVPLEIDPLTQLQQLDLSHNLIESLPAALADLATLAQLNLSHNRLATVPPELGQLTQLTRLDLSHNRLAALPPTLGHLTRLTRLYLSHNRLTTVPPELGQLTHLTRLYLDHNSLAALPPEIGCLTQLTRLYLSDNLLAALPPELGQLVTLTVLDVSHNMLGALPSEIGQLAKLTVLWLMENRLVALPESLGELEGLSSLSLHDNPALQLMSSVLGADPRKPQETRIASARSILDFYFARLAGNTRPLNEARLMVLGMSGAGKTSVVQALRDLPFRDREAGTAGVALCDWTMDGCQGPPVTVHVWDFSGQEITRALHPIFFSNRALYVVVLSGRGHREREDADYWLRLIQAHGSDDSGQGPPVIVAMNQWNVAGCRPEVDRIALRECYPFIRGFVEMDCKTKKGVPALKTALCREVDRMPWAREPFPEEWHAVHRSLTAPVTRPTTLNQDDYRALCVTHGVNDEGQQDYLSDILHHLGTALNYRNGQILLEAMMLQPEWLTRNLYALLRGAEKLAGVLSQADVEAVLHAEKNAASRAYLMHLMERLGLARPLSDRPGGAWCFSTALPDAPLVGVSATSGTEEVTS